MRFVEVKGPLFTGASMLTGLGFTENAEASVFDDRFKVDATYESCTCLKGIPGENPSNSVGLPRSVSAVQPRRKYEGECAPTSSISQGPSWANLVRPGVYLEDMGAVQPRIILTEGCALASSTWGEFSRSPTEDSKCPIKNLGEQEIV